MTLRSKAGRWLLGLCVLAQITASAFASGRSAVMVFPARHRMVRLMFDLSRIESLQLVSYASSRAADGAILYFWTGRDWAELSLADYHAGSFLRGTPGQVVLIGDAATLPPALSGDPAWAASTARFSTLDTTTLLNELGQLFGFSPGKWRWLAERYRLEIKDLNAERRRYGRYGPPRSKRSDGPGEQAIPMPSPMTEIPPTEPSTPSPKTAEILPLPAQPLPSPSPMDK